MLKIGESSPRGIRGFTLVELLIVIAIIGILAGFALKAVSIVRENTDIALTKTLISQLHTAAESYFQDEGMYPGQGKPVDPEESQLKWAYIALLDDAKPNGKGGRNAPYAQIEEDKISVWDDDLGAYRPAKRSELHDPEIDKFISDVWGEPFVYRCNKGHKRQDWMHNASSFDIYSKGLDSKDQTKLGLDEANDDIGNW